MSSYSFLVLWMFHTSVSYSLGLTAFFRSFRISAYDCPSFATGLTVSLIGLLGRLFAFCSVFLALFLLAFPSRLGTTYCQPPSLSEALFFYITCIETVAAFGTLLRTTVFFGTFLHSSSESVADLFLLFPERCLSRSRVGHPILIIVSCGKNCDAVTGTVFTKCSCSMFRVLRMLIRLLRCTKPFLEVILTDVSAFFGSAYFIVARHFLSSSKSCSWRSSRPYITQWYVSWPVSPSLVAFNTPWATW